MEEREDRERERDAADDAWLRAMGGIDPAERRAAWRRWLRKTLEGTLQWPKQEAARERLIGQCAGEITLLVRQLRGRGWLLDGAALKVHVRALLEPIAKAQRAGKIKDFWPYFGEAVGRYVGAHAEEIQAHARRTGADEGTQSLGGVFAALGLGDKLKSGTSGTSMTEVITTRDAEVREKKAVDAAAEKAQLKLGL